MRQFISVLIPCLEFRGRLLHSTVWVTQGNYIPSRRRGLAEKEGEQVEVEEEKEEE